MNVYVVRHTKVALDKGICYGQSHVPLATSFAKEMNQLKQRLPTDFEMIISSDLQRCQQLAQALNVNNVELILEPRLREVNFGSWELKSWDDIFNTERVSYEAWSQDFVNIAPPQGETLKTMFNRVSYVIEALRQKKLHSILLVTHAGVIRCLWAYLLGYPLNNCFKLQVDYGEVLQISLHENSMFDVIVQKA